ncbi:inositol monophosphatase family protein [Corynebacterium aquilae]|uniref:inositol monophosphatase family protein n=1 Tax=Corynebacterium aquilae TaxID=203263 RepID=UPI0012ECE838|nr:inositol monophosphatase family protein [Corynebacterium aquilae]
MNHNPQPIAFTATDPTAWLAQPGIRTYDYHHNPHNRRTPHSNDTTNPTPPPTIGHDPAELRHTLQTHGIDLEELAAHARAIAIGGLATIDQTLNSDATAHTVDHTKSAACDPVTACDMAVENFAVTYLTQHRPDDSILGEEGSNITGTSAFQWIIDPIDGTVNFLYNIPMSAISVACAWNGHIIAGAVINTATEELYEATIGGGATLTDAAGERYPLHCNQPDNLPTSLLATGFSYNSHRRQQQGALITQLLGTIRDIRRMGSAALDLCQVAAGQVDLYFEHALNPWDFAAGALIAAESGAHVIIPTFKTRASDGIPVFAATPTTATDFAQLLHTHGAWNPLPDTTDHTHQNPN